MVPHDKLGAKILHSCHVLLFPVGAQIQYFESGPISPAPKSVFRIGAHLLRMHAAKNHEAYLPRWGPRL